MTEYASRGDARRSMNLLWGRQAPSGRGPRPGLELGEVVRTAIALADTEGLGAVSMRRIAEKLQCSAMSLYTYVPGKAELLDLMLDASLGELPTRYELAKGWRAAAEASVRARWAFYARHPWVLQIAVPRALLGPHELDVLEAEVRIFDGLGLTPVQMMRAVSALGSFVRGAAKSVADARAAERETGISDDAWWAARAPLLTEMAGDFDARYPTIARIGSGGAFEQVDRPEPCDSYTVQEALDTFEFGLQRMLDGLERLVAQQLSPSHPRSPRMSPKQDDSLPKIGAPATRALEGAGIRTLSQVALRRESELAALHGVGPKAIRLLKEALAAQGKTFRSE